MRTARVLSVALEQPGECVDRAETNRRAILEALERGADYDPDVVCFPEMCLQHRADSKYQLAEPIPGPTTEAVAEAAAGIDAAVLVPMVERDGETYHNTTALLDRTGDLRGSYRKVRPTLSELEAGVVPGDGTVVWDTPFGRTSTVTCFDVNFPGIGARLARQRPRIVFFPSLFPGGDLLSAWALQYGFYVVQCTPTAASVITPTGETVAANDDRNIGLDTDLDGGATARFSFSEINTDFEIYHLDFNTDALEAIRRAYPDAVTLHKASDEALVLLESVSESVSVEDIEAEFDIENRWAYLQRSAAACRQQSGDGHPDQWV